jgi:hypothetical protein
VDGCFRKQVAPPLCREHRRLFFKKVDKNGPIPEYAPHLGPCHMWTGKSVVDGYGRFRAGSFSALAHVLAWTLEHGEPPPGTQGDHLCRVRLCCNPAHQERVSASENTQRAADAKRAGFSRS